MPIVVKDFKWHQTEDTIVIQLPLRSVPSKDVDVFTSPQYLKISYPPNFCEVLLLHEVDIDSSECVITRADINLTLTKKERVAWTTLEIENLSKPERNQMKTRLIEEEHARIRERVQVRKEKKSELKKFAVREAIRLDTKEREDIAKIKDYEKNKALGDISSWQIEKQTDKSKKPKKHFRKTLHTPNIPECKEALSKYTIPAIRKTCSVEITFTPRHLPTPSRESRLEEENEWLRKQAEARRSVGFVSEDLRAEEKNPVYLKAKGDDFIKKNNYLAAISAYSFGISLSHKYVDLYIGRSEAQFLQGNFNRAIEDCSTALELMKPAVEANFNQRVLCISRRGICLLKLGLYAQAVNELKVAMKMKSDDDTIKESLAQAQYELENMDSD